MGRRLSKLSWKNLFCRNERGQMAIFVALIFQILFFFFAMAINIALVVHDKINLQNATDLATYYAAQRQAEMLNVIAHTNYQIRQSWKLLNWRYYVLGSMGWKEKFPHPAFSGQPGSDQQQWPPAENPVMCVTYQPVWTIGTDDSTCREANFNAPNIQVPTTVAPFVPGNLLFEALAKKLQKAIASTCTDYAGLNWFFASAVYRSYALDQQSRKDLIFALAENLARPFEEMVDLNGDSVYQGALNTFRKNLTGSNAQGNPQLVLHNSMLGLKPNEWLNDIDVWFTLYYQNLTGTEKSCDAGKLDIKVFDLNGPPANNLKNILGDPGGQKIGEMLQYIQNSQSIAAGSEHRISLGIEKNPWYLVYVAAKAQSEPRQIFFPFGEASTFVAKAYAQPFGGRVGPWYSKGWARGSPGSSGDRVQNSPERRLANGMFNTNADAKYLSPQYSKYPGDMLGLRSVFAQQGLTNQYAGIKTSIFDYAYITQDPGQNSFNDFVAYPSDPQNSSIRQYEVAAIAPDLFDITYYSIQPNFGERYLKKLRENVAPKLNLQSRAFPRGDMGSRDPDASQFSVKDQIAVARGQLQIPGSAAQQLDLQIKKAFWFVRDREHLLVDWMRTKDYGSYGFPDEYFGKCDEFDDKYPNPDNPRAPGGCLNNGGRAGYSVKIISPEMLRSPLSLGGPGVGQGTILNPPPEGF